MTTTLNRAVHLRPDNSEKKN